MLFISQPLTKVVEVTTPTTNFNLKTAAGSLPLCSVRVICKINSQLTASSTSNYAFDTGTSWYGSLLLVLQNNNVNGKAGNPGSNGSNGTIGASGAMGTAGLGNGLAFPSTSVFPTNGGNGGPGTNGGAGTNGTNGGVAIRVQHRVIWHTPSSTIKIEGGIGGTGGVGGVGGFGGGGGGGGAPGYGNPTGVGGWGTNGGRGEGTSGVATSGSSNGRSTSGNGGLKEVSGTASTDDTYTPWGGGRAGGVAGTRGATGANGSSGTRGLSINGVSLVTFVATPTIIGSTV